MATFWSSGIARLRTLLLVAGLIVSLPSVAAVHLIFERDIDVPGQTDLFLVSYASQADFLSNTLQAQTALPQAIAGNFSLGGLTVDALGAWHLILERDIDVPGQTDLFLASYASQADLLSNTLLALTALPQAIAGNFSLGGLTVDALGAWHLILERDIDVPGQTDLFLASYASQTDLLSNTLLALTALPQAIAGNFSLGGLSVDALGAWHLILERDIDVPGQTDLFLASYASQADLLSNTLLALTALPQAIAGNFSLGGFHIDVAAPPPNGVPEPGSAPLLGLGVMMLWLCRRVARGAASGRDGCRPFEAPWLGKLNALRLPAPAG